MSGLGVEVVTDACRSASEAATQAGITRREHQTLIALADGLNPSEIAQVLGIGLATARSHAKQLREKLGCTSALQAVVVGASLGLIPGVQWTRPAVGRSR